MVASRKAGVVSPASALESDELQLCRMVVENAFAG